MLLYIDPGTGSMLFTIAVGLLGTAVFALRKLFLKLRLSSAFSSAFPVRSSDAKRWAGLST